MATSLQPGSIPVVKFNGTGFQAWKMRIEAMLEDLDVEEALHAKPEGVENEIFKKKDRKARNVIIQWLGDGVLHTIHVAANLLKSDFSNKKWKSHSPGEKQISVVLQLEKPSKITNIDVGNENSAFLEVLVAKCSSSSEDFKVLVAATSLMTLKEAKFSENTNGVKFLKTDDLCEDTRDEKWDRVKIVCSQPYNSVTQFGLSFIVFHANLDSSPSGPDLGKFHLKTNDSEPSVASISAWSLMAKKKERVVESKGAAAVVAAIRGGDIVLPSAKNAPVIAKVTAITPEDVLDEGEDENNSATTPARKQKTPKAHQKNDKNAGKAPKRNLSPSKRQDSPKKKVKVAAVSHFSAKPKKPFRCLMDDVVFVISGFQNPLRSDIRNSALAMGAKYKADWDSTCTHLVCAFRNTPKFNQVHGSGKIIKKDWIEKCYESRKRFPWRRFALDPSDQAQQESEEEILEDTGPPPATLDNRRRVNDSSSEEDDIEKEVKRIKKRKLTSPKPKASPNRDRSVDNDEFEDDESPMNIAGPSGLHTRTGTNNLSPLLSDSSERIPETTKASSLATERKKKINIYEVETEEEASDGEGKSPAKVLQGLPTMPSYFETFNFLLLDDIEGTQSATLRRYILARLGNIVSDVQELSSSNPSYCITEDKKRFEEVRESFPNVIGVRPDWVWFCHDENSLQDFSAHLL
ncbi:hypothetical protein GE061_019011 [Apolygus lucorum]|uniref:BRCT domain-containing protein n=1 Tax=Apolygus lucorum TaxID=248454 RepID=A0A8S9X929_APOLU|nr:hypothetical protein GE061_019011 [Apolygus lucorum]